METFFSFLERRVDDCSSLLCIRLDPQPSNNSSRAGAPLKTQTAAAALDFCLEIVKQTAPHAAAFKPNAAFFELYGPDGWAALKIVIDAIQDQSNRLGSMIPVILDARRGDIASTDEAEAKSAFEVLGAHAITLSPNLGKDTIDLFLAYKEKGVFLLCKTSNPGSGDVQALPLADELTLHEHVAHLAQRWNSGHNIGLVAGANHPDVLRCLRAAAPELWFLAPGIGTQGGDLEAALHAGLRTDGKGMLVSVSHGIAQAANPARAAAELRDRIVNIQYALSK